jgi:hypothetical protein
VASFKLRVVDDFEASSANPRHFRELARASSRDHDRLILLSAAAFFIGAAAVIALQFVR